MVINTLQTTNIVNPIDDPVSVSVQRDVTSTMVSTPVNNVYQYQWGGRFHRVPQDFIMPNQGVTLRTALRLWYDGIPLSKISPFKFLDSKDFDENSSHYRKNLKVLSNLKSLMTMFIKYLPSNYSTLSVNQKDALYDQTFISFGRIHLKSGDDNNHLRKLANVQYTTLYAHYFLFKTMKPLN